MSVCIFWSILNALSPVVPRNSVAWSALLLLLLLFLRMLNSHVIGLSLVVWLNARYWVFVLYPHRHGVILLPTSSTTRKRVVGRAQDSSVVRV